MKHACDDLHLVLPSHHVRKKLGKLSARLDFHSHAVHIPEICVGNCCIDRQDGHGERRSDKATDGERCQNSCLDPIPILTKRSPNFILASSKWSPHPIPPGPK